MKVSELIKELQKFNPNLEIICNSDCEGNFSSELYQVSSGWYQPWRRFDNSEYYAGDHISDSKELDEEEKRKYPNAKLVVYIIPS